MFTIGFRDARSHFTRFIMSIIAIALGTAFIVGSFSFRNMLEGQLAAAYASSSEGDVYVRGADKSEGSSASFGSLASSSANYNTVSEKLVSEIKKTPGVTTAFALTTVSGTALVGRNGEVVTSGTAGVTTVSMAKDATWRSARFTSGTYPKGLEQIALLKATADAAGLKTGDSTTFVYPSGPKKVKVSGIFTLDEVAQGTLFVGIDPSTAREETAYMLTGGATSKQASDAAAQAAAASSASGTGGSSVSASGSPASAPSPPSSPSAGVKKKTSAGSGLSSVQARRSAAQQKELQERRLREAREQAERKRQEAIDSANEYVTSITVYGDTNNGKPLTQSQQEALAQKIGSQIKNAPANSGKHKASAVTGDTLRSEQKDSINDTMGFVQPMILIFAFIALFVGTFIIANTFSMIVRESMRGYALLRSVGASPSQVFSTVIIQALMMGVVGSVIGVLLGWGMIALISAGLARFGFAMSGPSIPGFDAVGTAFAVGIIISLIGAALPARRAALAPPIQAMNETVNPQKPTRLRGWLGLAMMVIGALFWWFAAARAMYSGKAGEGPTPVRWLNSLPADAALGIGAGFVVLSVIIITPSLVVPAQKVLGSIPQLLFPVSGKLASRNLDRSKRRTANTAAALFVGLAIVSCVGTLTSSITASTAGIVDNGMKSDFVVRSQVLTSPLPSDLKSDLEKVGGVRSVTSMNLVPNVKYDGKELSGMGSRSVNVSGNYFRDVMDVHMVSGTADSAVNRGELVVGKTLADNNKWKVGQTLTLSTAEGETKAKVGAVTDSTEFSYVVFLPKAVTEKLSKTTAEHTTVMYVTAKPGTDLNAVQKRIKEKVKKYYVISVLNKEEFKSTIATMINGIMVIIYALLALSIIIAVFGVVNTMALSISERTREIGLLRAIGTGNGQVRGMIAIEAVMISVLGTVLGIITGVAAGAVVQKVYTDNGLGTLDIPWQQILVFLGLSVVIGLIASLWPARSALKIPVLNAVSDE
ncbi:FtsX-like permease family protein [Scardovia wiggsiae]|uniref:ABC transporter permease n=1 Tax=Scardovia wiggsiae TaxID=230143 RepID=UPI00374FBD5D